MSYLSYKKAGKGYPVAKLVQPDKKNRYIYLNDSEDKSVDSKFSYNDLDLLDEGYFSDKGNKFNIEKFKLQLLNKDKKLGNDYDKAKQYIKDKRNKEIIIHEGEIMPIPIGKERECIYVAGPSGSGKSTYISNYAKEYRRLHPKNPIFVFSRVSEDKCIDALNPTRIMINEELISDPISPEELKDSLVIFDDTDTIPSKKLRDAITGVKSDILETGRHNNVSIAVSSHLLTNYKETRTILNESHQIILFPGSGSSYSIRYLLRNYGGLSPKDIDKILHLPSRYICFKKTYPQLITYAKGIYLLNKN